MISLRFHFGFEIKQKKIENKTEKALELHSQGTPAHRACLKVSGYEVIGGLRAASGETSAQADPRL